MDDDRWEGKSYFWRTRGEGGPVEKANLISHCLILRSRLQPSHTTLASRAGSLSPTTISGVSRFGAVQSLGDKLLIEGFCGPPLTLIRGITGQRPPNVAHVTSVWSAESMPSDPKAGDPALARLVQETERATKAH